MERRRWLEPREFEDAIAACNLLPGPASTQLAIFCGWRVRGPLGALVAGAAFILPGLVLIVALAALFLAGSPPTWVRGRGCRRGRRGPCRGRPCRLGPRAGQLASRRGEAAWTAYVVAGGVAAATVGPWLVLVLLGCGLIELMLRRITRGQLARALASAAPRRRRCERGPPRARVGGAQGGRALLRRRVRDRAPDAVRRRPALRLDDGRRVPQRRRTRTGDTPDPSCTPSPWSAMPLQGWPARRSRRSSPSRRPSPSSCSGRAASTPCGTTTTRRHSSAVPGLPPSARSPASPSAGRRPLRRLAVPRPRGCGGGAARAPARVVLTLVAAGVVGAALALAGASLPS